MQVRKRRKLRKINDKFFVTVDAMNKNKRWNIKTLTTLGVLIALEIILSRFLSIHTWNIKIGFSFVPVVISACLFSPIVTGLMGGISDVIGAMLFPVGAYFPGFTLTAFLTGVVYSMVLKKSQSIKNIIVAVLIVQILGSLLLNTLWISILYGSPFGALLVTRIYQTVIMSVVQIVVITIVSKRLVPMLKTVCMAA